MHAKEAGKKLYELYLFSNFKLVKRFIVRHLTSFVFYSILQRVGRTVTLSLLKY